MNLSHTVYNYPDNLVVFTWIACGKAVDKIEALLSGSSFPHAIHILIHSSSTTRLRSNCDVYLLSELFPISTDTTKTNR